jgi:adenine deaminase
MDAEDALQKDKDVAYIAVIERYGKTNNIGLGFVQGFGLFNGALGTTVAHDSHNLLIIGKDIADMQVVAEHLAKVGGGFCVAEHQQILATVPLTIAGLMSTENASTVKEQMENLQNALKKIGCKNSAPFMTASFLALPVIPALKITDYGLISLDSTGFHKIPTAVTSEILNK